MKKQKFKINLFDINVCRRVINGQNVRFYIDRERNIKYINPDDISKIYGFDNFDQLKKDRDKYVLLMEYLDHTGTLIMGE